MASCNNIDFMHNLRKKSCVQYAYANPAGFMSLFPFSWAIRALGKFQMCRVCHGGCVVRLLRMKRRDSPSDRAQTGGHDDPTFVTSAP